MRFCISKPQLIIEKKLIYEGKLAGKFKYSLYCLRVTNTDTQYTLVLFFEQLVKHETSLSLLNFWYSCLKWLLKFSTNIDRVAYFSKNKRRYMLFSAHFWSITCLMNNVQSNKKFKTLNWLCTLPFWVDFGGCLILRKKKVVFSCLSIFWCCLIFCKGLVKLLNFPDY